MFRQEKDKVYKILHKSIEARDDYFLLLFKVWLYELGDECPTEVKQALRYLFKARKEKRISAFESVTRASRKVQEEYPSLRGKHYEARKNKESKVRKEINK